MVRELFDLLREFLMDSEACPRTEVNGVGQLEFILAVEACGFPPSLDAQLNLLVDEILYAIVLAAHVIEVLLQDLLNNFFVDLL